MTMTKPVDSTIAETGDNTQQYPPKSILSSPEKSSTLGLARGPSGYGKPLKPVPAIEPPPSSSADHHQQFPLAPPPVKRVEFKTTPEVERKSSFRSSRSSGGERDDKGASQDDQPRGPGPSRGLGSIKKAPPVSRQSATKGFGNGGGGGGDSSDTGDNFPGGTSAIGDKLQLANGSSKTAQKFSGTTFQQPRAAGPSTSLYDDDQWYMNTQPCTSKQALAMTFPVMLETSLSEASKPPSIIASSLRRPSESGSDGSSATSSSAAAAAPTPVPTGKIVKRTTFKEDLEEEIPPLGGAHPKHTPLKSSILLRSPPSSSDQESNPLEAAQPLQTSPSTAAPTATSTSGKSRRFVSLHSYPPTSAAIEADQNLGHVLRSYQKGSRVSEPSEKTSTTAAVATTATTSVAGHAAQDDDDAPSPHPHHHHHHHHHHHQKTKKADEVEEQGRAEESSQEKEQLSSKHPLPLTRKPPLPPNKPKDYVPFSARLKSLRKDHKVTTPSTLLQSKLQSTISKRIRDHSREGSAEGATALLLNNIDGLPSSKTKIEEERLDQQGKKKKKKTKSSSPISSGSSSSRSSSTDSTSGSGSSSSRSSKSSSSSSSSSSSDSASDSAGDEDQTLKAKKTIGAKKKVVKVTTFAKDHHHHHHHHRHHHHHHHSTKDTVEEKKVEDKDDHDVDDDELDVLGELEGGTGAGGANGGKQFNLVKAQMLVNEVHDWWLMHLG